MLVRQDTARGDGLVGRGGSRREGCRVTFDMHMWEGRRVMGVLVSEGRTYLGGTESDGSAGV